MKKFKIKYKEIEEILTGEEWDFPKYSTQLLNIANQNAQGTRPKVVGQMSELIQEFPGKTIEEWEMWYRKKNPDAIEEATDRVYDMIENFKEVIQEIDRDMVEKWIDELVIVKTFIGLRFQDAIIQKVAEEKDMEYRLAKPEEESKGIDGYIGYTPVSIKPTTYQAKQNLIDKSVEQII
jgi:hypothetical protein